MDKHNTHYGKQHGGHQRNINTYRLFQQKMKKWRKPIIAIAVLIGVFGTWNISGETYKTSVLHNVANTSEQCVEKESAAVSTLQNAVMVLSAFDQSLSKKVAQVLEEFRASEFCAQK